MPRQPNDHPGFDHLHETLIDALHAYEKSARRRRKHVVSIVVTFTPKKEPWFDIDLVEVDIGQPGPAKP